MATRTDPKGLDVPKLLLEIPLYFPVSLGDQDEAGVRAILIFDGALDTYCPGCSQSATFRGIVTPETKRDSDAEKMPTMGLSGRSHGVFRPWAKRDFSKSLRCTRGGHVFTYYFICERNAITKVGQYPSLADIEKPETQKYEKLLGKDRLKELNRAIGLAAHGVGVGAYIYLRRVFESLIEDAHDEAMKAVPNWDEIAYKQQRTSERISTLKKFLPAFLVESPRLYGILSLGVHELTEDQCLANFEALKLGIQVILDEKLSEAERRAQADAARKALARIDPEKRS